MRATTPVAASTRNSRAGVRPRARRSIGGTWWIPCASLVPQSSVSMSSFVGRLRALALALGAPGLFLVAFLDSSILSLPEIADLLVVYMVMQHRSRLLLYAASATLGSVA